MIAYLKLYHKAESASAYVPIPIIVNIRTRAKYAPLSNSETHDFQAQSRLRKDMKRKPESQ